MSDPLTLKIIAFFVVLLLSIGGLAWRERRLHDRTYNKLSEIHRDSAAGQATAQESLDVAEGGRAQLARHEEQDHSAQDRGHVVTLKQHIIQLINLLRPPPPPPE